MKGKVVLQVVVLVIQRRICLTITHLIGLQVIIGVLWLMMDLTMKIFLIFLKLKVLAGVQILIEVFGFCQGYYY